MDWCKGTRDQQSEKKETEMKTEISSSLLLPILFEAAMQCKYSKQNKNEQARQAL